MKHSAPRHAHPEAAPATAAQHPGAAATAQRAPAWLTAPTGEAGPLTAKQDRDRASLAHLSVALGLVGPLAVWLRYRDRGPFTAQEAKEALNFAAPPTLVVILLFLLGVVPVLGPLFSIAGAILWAAMACYGVMGASHVSKGRPFRYPFNLRILR